MSSQMHNEKKFTLGDVQFYTVFSAIVDSPIKRSPLHTHSQYELFMFADGQGYVDFGNKRTAFKRGSVILIAPNTEHSVVCAEGASPIAMSFSFNFKKAGENKRRGDERLYSLLDALIPKECDSISMRDKYFTDFTRSFIAQSEPNPELASMLISNMLEGLFLNIIRKLAKRNSERGTVPIYSYTTSAVTNDVILASVIERYMLSMSCTLTDLAAHLNMCPRNTQKVLRKIFGKSFSEILADKRLGRAVQLMSSTDLSLSEIAKQVCYNQYPSFRKAFVSKFGKSPFEYRAELIRAREQ